MTIPQRLREIATRADYAAQVHERRSVADSLRAIAAELEAPAAGAAPVMAEYPAGAVENGRAYAARLESAYQFECEAGPLSNCSDWHDLIRCFEHLAAWPANHIATVAALQQQLGECSGGYETMEREVAALQARIDELEARWNLCSACNSELGGAK